jgi:hypothetical protein
MVEFVLKNRILDYKINNLKYEFTVKYSENEDDVIELDFLHNELTKNDINYLKNSKKLKKL